MTFEGNVGEGWERTSYVPDVHVGDDIVDCNVQSVQFGEDVGTGAERHERVVRPGEVGTS